MPPTPLPFDVGYAAASQSFLFRSAFGVVSDSHPATAWASEDGGDDGGSAGAGDNPAMLTRGGVPAFSVDDDGVYYLAHPLFPPLPFVLRPEATGAWCYENTVTGAAQWSAPPMSTPITDSPLCSIARFRKPAPPMTHELCYTNLDKHVEWVAVFEDAARSIRLFNVRTGCLRVAPWLSLRTGDGTPYFINLNTRESRWYPPAGWWEGWLSRPEPLETSACGVSELDGVQAYRRNRLPVKYARLLVEGGAPYLYDQGAPQYPPDYMDNKDTHPLARQ